MRKNDGRFKLYSTELKTGPATARFLIEVFFIRNGRTAIVIRLFFQQTGRLLDHGDILAAQHRADFIAVQGFILN
jgi:hypothetical protein